VASEQSVDGAWTGHARGSAAYGRLLAALFCAGVATFAQLYSPQAVLPLISKDLDVGAANAALLISSSTVGLAIGVIPWSALADRIGRKSLTICWNDLSGCIVRACTKPSVDQLHLFVLFFGFGRWCHPTDNLWTPAPLGSNKGMTDLNLSLNRLDFLDF